MDGNTSDKTTLKEFLAKIEKQYGKAKRTWVMDGPMLEALKGLKGATIYLPGRSRDCPDRDRLALRFERFKAVV